MKTYHINKHFNSHKECEKWEEENLTVDGRQMYNGEYILMTCHDSAIGSDEITLTDIITV